MNMRLLIGAGWSLLLPKLQALTSVKGDRFAQNRVKSHPYHLSAPLDIDMDHRSQTDR
jgi:hypothetical protein